MQRWTIRSAGVGKAALAVVLLGALGGACDDIRVETDPAHRSDPDVRAETVRTHLTPAGIGDLFEVSHPEGLLLEEGAQDRMLGDRPLSIGPLSQPIPISDVDANVGDDALGLALSDQRLAVTIPVRVERSVGTEICRFRLTTGPWTIQVESDEDPETGWKSTPSKPVSLETNGLQVTPVEECPVLRDDSGEFPAQLDEILTNYLQSSIENGVGEFLDISIYEQLGLLRGRTSLHRLSAFPNRQGAIDVVGRTTESEKLRLDSTGLSADLGIGTSSRRARCARPDALSAPSEDRTADPIRGEDLQGTDAALGLVVARPLLVRLVEAMTSGGFLCRGLERTDGVSGIGAPINRRDAALDDIGLASVPIEGPFRPTLSPGRLDDLQLRPDTNTVAITWSGLTLELYGRLGGAQTKLVTLSADVEFFLIPAGGAPETLRFDINAIDVDDVSFQSPWREDAPEQTALNRWSRRLVLAVFENTFEVPTPVLPDAPLSHLQTRVRSDDLLLLLIFQS